MVDEKYCEEPDGTIHEINPNEEKEIQEMVEEFKKFSVEEQNALMALMDSIILEDFSPLISNTKH